MSQTSHNFYGPMMTRMMSLINARVYLLLVVLSCLLGVLEIYFTFSQRSFVREGSAVPNHTRRLQYTPVTLTEKSSTSASSGCKMPQINPFPPRVMRLVDKSYSPLNCSKGLPSLVYLDGMELKVNFTKMGNTVGKVDYCKYQSLAFKNKSDHHVILNKWSPRFLSNPMRIADTDELIKAVCLTNNIVVSEYFTTRVIKKPDVEKRCAEKHRRHLEENSPWETLNVLVVGVDGMSRQNLMRTMPKTREFIINELNAREFYKLNKVGDNSFPNIMAMQTGLFEHEIKRNWSDKTYFDELKDKFFWSRYQDAGYRMLMSVDATWMSVFHYLRNGWRKPPFDYYIRPLTVTIENHSKNKLSFAKGCVGDTTELSILHNYILQAASTFNESNTPYIMHNFYTYLTHDYQLQATRGDQIYFNLFKELKRRNVLNNTVTIFFSDHGPRFGSFRQTTNGRVEINAPFMFFMFPPWFEAKYPEVMKTFETNQNRLTTFFDVHATLTNLLNFKGQTGMGSVQERGISLFREIPAERTCSHAEIPIEYCNCKLISDQPVPSSISQAVVDELVKAVNAKTKEIESKCARLSLKSVKSVIGIDMAGTRDRLYQATVKLTPGGGEFEALFNYDPKTGGSSVIGVITRLNYYAGQDQCVQKVRHKLYCFCQKS